MAVARKQREVSTTALPAARRTAAETDISEGAAVAGARAKTFQTVADIGGAVATQGVRIFGREQAERRRVIERERQNANDVAVLAGDNRLAAWLRENVYDSEKGALAQQGPASFELPEKLEQEFNKLAGEIERSLGNDEQRLAFNRIRSNRGEALSHTIHAHVARERQSYAAGELKANTENAVDLIIANAHNPELARRELAGAISYIERVGPQLGMGPEAVDAAVGDLRTRSIGGTISRLIDQGNPEAARVYFDELKSQISGEQLGRLEAALKVGELKKRAQTKADEILQAGGTIDQWREKARAIENPDEREEVMRLVEHEQAFVERRKRDEDEGRMRRAADIIDRTKSVRGVPASDIALMSPSQRKALDDYAEHKATGVEVKTDFPALYRLMQQAGDDPDEFAKVNLLDFVNRIGKADLEQLGNVQLSIKNGERRKAETVIDGFMSPQQIVNDTLLKGGLDPSPQPGNEQVEPVTRFREEVNKAVEALQAATKKKATDADIKTIADSLFRKVIIEGSRPGYWLWPGSDVAKALVELPAADRIGRMTLADMPPSLRALAEDSLRRRGQPVSDDAVLGLFRRYLITQLPKSR